ncbi:hypothetical protein AN964_16475 [Heyndrickxia shackletonii]|uniref:Uncharacterized protein n=1 Tax=Heyndrickxia shackletonii TaxID=157838 RepID=A0A0Q3WYP7_9BACI|nr:hypothetical protein AN964_16475 [Heyndrickxia shackletonii]
MDETVDGKLEPACEEVKLVTDIIGTTFLDNDAFTICVSLLTRFKVPSSRLYEKWRRSVTGNLRSGLAAKLVVNSTPFVTNKPLSNKIPWLMTNIFGKIIYK